MTGGQRCYQIFYKKKRLGPDRGIHWLSLLTLHEYQTTSSHWRLVQVHPRCHLTWTFDWYFFVSSLSRNSMCWFARSKRWWRSLSGLSWTWCRGNRRLAVRIASAYTDSASRLPACLTSWRRKWRTCGCLKLKTKPESMMVIRTQIPRWVPSRWDFFLKPRVWTWNEARRNWTTRRTASFLCQLLTDRTYGSSSRRQSRRSARSWRGRVHDGRGQLLWLGRRRRRWWRHLSSSPDGCLSLAAGEVCSCCVLVFFLPALRFSFSLRPCDQLKDFFLAFYDEWAVVISTGCWRIVFFLFVRECVMKCVHMLTSESSSANWRFHFFGFCSHFPPRSV